MPCLLFEVAALHLGAVKRVENQIASRHGWTGCQKRRPAATSFCGHGLPWRQIRGCGLANKHNLDPNVAFP
jgi:hypothetical protein